jgi:zinc/manganese transport system permease protein
MADLVGFLTWPFLAATIFVAIHCWFGLQVLRRQVIFADLALAQLAAFGATVATAIGHPPASLAAYLYALSFTGCGAALLAGSRRFAAAIMPEALVGILYVVAASATVLVVDQAPQGAEHVKRMLVGSILTLGPADVARLAAIYGIIASIHVAARRKLLAPGSGMIWDLLFYATFGAVVTSSVNGAGVLLVFSFLVIPAVIGTLFSARIGVALAIGWGCGIAASAIGFVVSFALDLPTGAATVLAFAGVLCIAAMVRWLSPGRARVLAALRTTAIVSLAAIVGSALWLLAYPAGDQPLASLLEQTPPFYQHPFLTEHERDALAEAAEMEARYRTDVDRLTAMEQRARWQGDGLSDDDVLRLGSFQQSFNEMGRGERFVQTTLRRLERERERWWIAPPVVLLGAVGLAFLLRRPMRARYLLSQGPR